MAKPDAAFPDTRWTLIQQRNLRTESPELAAAAAEDLCTLYWKPIFAFISASIRNRDEAEDLTQEFFASALKADIFATVDPAKGKLRNYLLGAVKHFLSNQRRKYLTQKRGGEISFQSVDESHAELPDSKMLPADRAFDRQWAKLLVESALEQLQTEYQTRSKQDWFECPAPSPRFSRKTRKNRSLPETRNN